VLGRCAGQIKRSPYDARRGNRRRHRRAQSSQRLCSWTQCGELRHGRGRLCGISPDEGTLQQALTIRHFTARRARDTRTRSQHRGGNADILERSTKRIRVRGNNLIQLTNGRPEPPRFAAPRCQQSLSLKRPKAIAGDGWASHAPNANNGRGPIGRLVSFVASRPLSCSRGAGGG